MTERMYNGIDLPSEWPPRSIVYESDEPLPVPYLQNPPAIIPIDIGRQLFVDDFLIAETTLSRTYHAARVRSESPVLVPDTEQELDNGYCPSAAPFNDGVWYDAEEGLFKMWYMPGFLRGVALATSKDGIHWERPDLDVIPGTNAVFKTPSGWRRDGALVWRDPEAEESMRYRMLLFFRRPDGECGHLYTSRDGVHWQEQGRTSHCGDNTSFFYNPFVNRFAFSIRQGWPNRGRAYHEHADFIKAGQWKEGDQVWWGRSDCLDQPDPLVGDRPQLYDLNAVAYESIMLGAFNILYGPQNPVGFQTGDVKLIDMQPGYSRDGFHFSRPDRGGFIRCSRQKNTWDRGYIHAAGGLCLVVGEELWFYYGAFSGESEKLGPGDVGDEPHRDHAIYAGSSTGLAVLRRDGFASMDADENGGMLETRPVTFKGKHLFVNADLGQGELRVEIVDEKGALIAPFTRSECTPMQGDSTKARVHWQGVDNLSGLCNMPVRFRFSLTGGRLYAFWVSPSEKGESNGYLGAGGPGFAGLRDD